nr:hypothetical protein [Methanophagales archaeon]
MKWTIIHKRNANGDLVRWQNIWTEWSDGKKLEINARGDESYECGSIPGVEFLIDEYQVPSWQPRPWR